MLVYVKTWMLFCMLLCIPKSVIHKSPDCDESLECYSADANNGDYWPTRETRCIVMHARCFKYSIYSTIQAIPVKYLNYLKNIYFRI